MFTRQLREFIEQLLLRHATCEVPEHIADRDAGSADTWLTEPDFRIDCDVLEEVHVLSLRHLTAPGKPHGRDRSTLSGSLHLTSSMGDQRVTVISANLSITTLVSVQPGSITSS